VLHQQQLVEQMQRNNLRNFQLVLTEKQKIKYPIARLSRIELGDGWYCHITDNQL